MHNLKMTDSQANLIRMAIENQLNDVYKMKEKAVSTLDFDMVNAWIDDLTSMEEHMNKIVFPKKEFSL